MNHSDWSKKDLEYIWHPCSQMKDYETLPPIVVDHGKGVNLYDVDGKRYLDVVSSWWCNLLGHSHPKINRAIKEQLDSLEHVIFANFSHRPAITLCVPGIRFSCATGEGRKELEEAIIQAFSSSLPGETGSSLVAINARHQHELGLCREHVRLASESISRQESPEFTALELREALTHLGEITGAVDTEDVLGAIFSSFCLGK